MDNSVMDNASDISQAQNESISQPTEKMVPQSQVNEIAAAARRQGAERAVEEYKRQQTPSSIAQVAQNHEPLSYKNMSEDDVKRVTGDEVKRYFTQIEHEAQERANVESANRIVGMFRDKIVAGKDKFQDFETVTGNVAMKFYPNVVQLLAEHVDNTADVLYHLAKNRDKLYRLEALSSHNSSDAVYEIKRLSESIKSNEEISALKQANSPLSQQRPSNTGTESGSLSMADLKRRYRV